MNDISKLTMNDITKLTIAQKEAVLKQHLINQGTFEESTLALVRKLFVPADAFDQVTVVREITYTGTREAVARQLKSSKPLGLSCHGNGVEIFIKELLSNL